MPSYYEGMPIVLLEAMASRTACIVYTVGDVKKRFKDKEEIITLKTGDKEGLHNWVLNLSKNKRLRTKIAKNGFEKVKKEYDWEKIVKKIDKIFKNIIVWNNHGIIHEKFKVYPL